MNRNCESINEENEKKSRPMLRLLIGLGLIVCIVAGFFAAGVLLHRDEGDLEQANSLAEVLQAVEGVPDVVVPELGDAKDAAFALYTGGHGSSTDYVGYRIAWKGSVGEKAAEYELDCNQTNEKTGSHELYRDVFIENSAYEKNKSSDWTSALRFTLGKQVYALRGRCDTAGMTDEQQTELEKALEAQLRPILEQIIDKSKDGK